MSRLLKLQRRAGEAERSRYSGKYLGVRTRPLLSDYTWNHTTLWAMNTDPAYTYLQCAI